MKTVGNIIDKLTKCRFSNEEVFVEIVTNDNSVVRYPIEYISIFYKPVIKVYAMKGKLL